MNAKFGDTPAPWSVPDDAPKSIQSLFDRATLWVGLLGRKPESRLQGDSTIRLSPEVVQAILDGGWQGRLAKH